MSKVQRTGGLITLFLASALAVAAQKTVNATIVVSNPLPVARNEVVLAVDWKMITAKYPGIDTLNFKVLDASGREIPWQLEHHGDPAIRNLLLQLSLEAGGSIQLRIVPGRPAVIAAKTFGRYVPERKDDFAWENDRIAFRMYGKALEGSRDNAFGMDVWAKRTSRLVINDWYKTDDYHKDHGEGLDYYQVGLTLGAGDIAPFTGDSVVFPLNYRTWKVLDKGPLRFTFELGYAPWQVAGKMVKVTKTISLDAGSQMNRIEAVYEWSAGQATLPVVTGIVRREAAGQVLFDEQCGMLGYWEPAHGTDGTIGTGTVIPGGPAKMTADRVHLLSHGTALAGQPFVYYSGAAWNKAGRIRDAKEWFNYLMNFKQSLDQPLKVNVR